MIFVLYNLFCDEMMVFYASFVHIVYAKLGQADAGDNEAKLMAKLAPEKWNDGVLGLFCAHCLG